MPYRWIEQHDRNLPRSPARRYHQGNKAASDRRGLLAARPAVRHGERFDHTSCGAVPPELSLQRVAVPQTPKEGSEIPKKRYKTID